MAQASDGEDAAPSELLAEFLSAIMSGRYRAALRHCRNILRFEPHNSTARGFCPLLEERAAGESSGDSTPDTEPRQESMELDGDSGSEGSWWEESGGASTGESGGVSVGESGGASMEQSGGASVGDSGGASSAASSAAGSEDSDSNGNPPPPPPPADRDDNDNATLKVCVPSESGSHQRRRCTRLAK